MTDWTIVLWSAARQVAIEAGLPKASWPDDDTLPQQFFNSLRQNGENMQAIAFMAAALPRAEAIEWALHALPEIERADPDYAPRRLLRDAAHRWVDEPDDENRRAIFALAENADRSWPETLLGLAIYFSGGSIAPEENAPVTADPTVCSTLVSTALQTVVAANAAVSETLMTGALDLADKIAMQGRKAFSRT